MVVPHGVCKLLVVCAAQANAAVPSTAQTARDNTFCVEELALMQCSDGGLRQKARSHVGRDEIPASAISKNAGTASQPTQPTNSKSGRRMKDHAHHLTHLGLVPLAMQSCIPIFCTVCPWFMCANVSCFAHHSCNAHMLATYTMGFVDDTHKSDKLRLSPVFAHCPQVTVSARRLRHHTLSQKTTLFGHETARRFHL